MRKVCLTNKYRSVPPEQLAVREGYRLGSRGGAGGEHDERDTVGICATRDACVTRVGCWKHVSRVDTRWRIKPKKPLEMHSSSHLAYLSNAGGGSVTTVVEVAPAWQESGTCCKNAAALRSTVHSLSTNILARLAGG